MTSLINRLLFPSLLSLSFAGVLRMADGAGGGDITELDQNLDAFDDYETLPKSSYPAECVLAEKRISEKGNEYYYTNWTISPEDYPADYDKENAPEGTTLNYSRVQVPQNNDRRSITQVKKLYRAMGLSLKTKEIDPETWVGQKAKLVVGVGKFNGEQRNEIISIESLEA